MTNKFYTKTANLSVYVVNLAEYDKYNLVEDYTNPNQTEGWVSLPINKEDWEEFLTTIGNPEEYAIHDYENNSEVDGLEIKEHENIEDLNKLAETLEDLNKLAETLEEIEHKGMGNVFNALYEVLGDLNTVLDYLESGDYVFYENMTIEELAKKRFEECFNIPSSLENRIDYSGLAHDMRYDGYYDTEYGVIVIL